LTSTGLLMEGLRNDSETGGILSLA